MPKLKHDAEISRSYGFASLSPAIEKSRAGSKVTILGRDGNSETSMGSHKVRVRDEKGNIFTTDASNITD
jgi:hypothetical protein